jgi:hypothetical protein
MFSEEFQSKFRSVLLDFKVHNGSILQAWNACLLTIETSNNTDAAKRATTMMAAKQFRIVYGSAATRFLNRYLQAN